MPSLRVDGNDVLAVLAASRLALARAYAGQGPTLIEAVTYRMGPHTTSDDPTRYRSHAEEEEWRAKDPLVRLRALLHNEGLADDEFEHEVTTAAGDAATALRLGVLDMPHPAPEALFEHVYAGPHPLLDAERDAYLAYLAEYDEVS
jgi:pyruvate dehydrogenase E1 component alpha subunit